MSLNQNKVGKIAAGLAVAGVMSVAGAGAASADDQTLRGEQTGTEQTGTFGQPVKQAAAPVEEAAAPVGEAAPAVTEQSVTSELPGQNLWLNLTLSLSPQAGTPAPAPEAPAPAVPESAPLAPGNSGEHRAALPQPALENNQSPQDKTVPQDEGSETADNL